MSYETLIVEQSDNVGTIRLNRPDAMNALNGQLLSELADALDTMDNDPKIRAIILTGSDKAFAAGADIKEMADKTFVEMFNEGTFASASDAIMRCRTPIVAAVAGYCLGGGCELAMMCDVIIAADSAKFGQPEINLGIIPGIGGTQRLARAVGKAKAMEMCLTGRFMEAAEAESSGLVSRVVQARDLAEESRTVADKIAEKSPIAARAVKEALNRSFETTLAEGLLFEQRLFNGLFATEDQTEGMAAFMEKRSPQFRGK